MKIDSTPHIPKLLVSSCRPSPLENLHQLIEGGAKGAERTVQDGDGVGKMQRPDEREVAGVGGEQELLLVNR